MPKVTLANGRFLLTNRILPVDRIKIGQVWAPVDGVDRTVRILNVDTSTGRVLYQSIEHPEMRCACKDWLTFQCRYCRVMGCPVMH